MKFKKSWLTGSITRILIMTSFVAITSCSDKKVDERNYHTAPSIELYSNRVSPISASQLEQGNPPVKISTTNIEPDAELTDGDENLRTVDYYLNHKDELNKKLWECKTFPLSTQDRYTNCLNAKQAFESFSG